MVKKAGDGKLQAVCGDLSQGRARHMMSGDEEIE